MQKGNIAPGYAEPRHWHESDQHPVSNQACNRCDDLPTCVCPEKECYRNQIAHRDALENTLDPPRPYIENGECIQKDSNRIKNDIALERVNNDMGA